MLLAAAIALVVGCSGSQSSIAARDADHSARQLPAGRPDSELVRTLLQLGEGALATGDLRSAQQRFRRALVLNPDSVAARLGLARLALRTGDGEAARRWLDEALARDPGASGVLLALAQLDLDAGAPARADSLLRRAVAASPRDPRIHHALFKLTGPAPPLAGPSDLASAIRRADSHPYDLRAAVRVARLQVAAGEAPVAMERLRGLLFAADLDPEAARAAVDLLRAHDPSWGSRRVVWVHCYADDTVRREVAWQMRLRILWHAAGETLDPLLDTAFLPASMSTFAFSGAGAAGGARLDPIESAWLSRHPSLPQRGILAGFTERARPSAPGTWRLGQAELMGRRLIVRLEPDQTASRTLIHELIHLYGGVHIRAEVDSLMNPKGKSQRLDPANARIVEVMTARRFRGGGLAMDVLPYVDLEALTEAYRLLLGVNLTFRKLGLDEAMAESESARFYAADLVRKNIEQDSHLGDVAKLIARLLLFQDRAAEAALFLEAAANLYGPKTPGGRAARENVDRIYENLKARGEL